MLHVSDEEGYIWGADDPYSFQTTNIDKATLLTNQRRLDALFSNVIGKAMHGIVVQHGYYSGEASSLATLYAYVCA